MKEPRRCATVPCGFEKEFYSRVAFRASTSAWIVRQAMHHMRPVRLSIWKEIEVELRKYRAVAAPRDNKGRFLPNGRARRDRRAKGSLQSTVKTAEVSK